MSATNYLKKKIVDLLTGAATYAPPPLYVSLHHSDPTVTGDQTQEITGGNYTRKSLAGKMSVADPVTGISTNTAAINFGPASTDWGTVAYIAIQDAASGGNMLIPSAPTAPKSVTTGQPFQIAPGNLKIRL